MQAEPDAAAVADVLTRVAVVAPQGRYAAVVRDLLAAEGIGSQVAGTLAALLDLLGAHVGFFLLTEEALTGAEVETVREALSM